MMKPLLYFLLVWEAVAQDFAGKVCYITGATSGLGEYIAVEAAKEGCAVSLVGRRKEMGDVLVAKIEASGGKAMFSACDVSDESCIAASIAKTVESFGGLDYTLNNAGGASKGDGGPPHLMEVSDFDKVMDSNVKGLFICMKHEIKAMLDLNATTASVVNVGSIYSVTAQVQSTAYVTSKHALVGLTKVFGLHYARDGIRVNNLAPTYFRTPLTELKFVADERGAGTIRDYQPSGTYCELEDLWGALKWLWSDGSLYYNAQSLVIDGGLTASHVPPSYQRPGLQRTTDIINGLNSQEL